MAYIGRGTDNISNVEVLDNITFNGNSSYTLQKGGANFVPVSANNILLSIDGVVQANNFSVSGSTIDFGTAVTGTCNFVLHFGTGLITTVQDGAVTTVKIGDDAVTYAKLQNLATANRVLGSTSTGLIGETQIATAMVSDDAITYAKMQDTSTANRILGAASAGTIGEVQVATDMIADAQVDESKLKISNTPTNGYALTAQSGNTGGLTWAAMSSDFVLLSSSDISSSTALVEFDGLFGTDYKNFKVIISGLLPVDNGVRLNAQMKEGGSYITSGAYTYLIGADIVYNTNSQSANNTEAATNGTAIIMTSEMKNSAGETNSLDITIYDPLGSHYKAMTWQNQNYGNALTNLFRNYVGGSVLRNSTNDCTAIKFYMDSGNISKGNFKLYGIK